MVAQCNFNSDTTCREKFNHVLTDQGICSAFNAVNQNVTFKETDYLNMFQSIYNSPTQSIPFNSIGAGTDSGLSLILDIHQTDIFGSESGYFELSLNAYLDSFSTESKFQAHPGLRYEVYVSVIEVMAESAVKDSVDIEHRPCRFLNEKHSNTHPLKSYTQKGCQFDCQMTQAFKIMNCTPWNFFRDDTRMNSPVCTRDHIVTFETAIANSTFECNDNCLEDCEGVIFDYSVNSMAVDPVVECLDENLVSLSMLGISERHDFFFWKYKSRTSIHQFC